MDLRIFCDYRYFFFLFFRAKINIVQIYFRNVELLLFFYSLMVMRSFLKIICVVCWRSEAFWVNWTICKRFKNMFATFNSSAMIGLLFVGFVLETSRRILRWWFTYGTFLDFSRFRRSFVFLEYVLIGLRYFGWFGANYFTWVSKLKVVQGIFVTDSKMVGNRQ